MEVDPGSNERTVITVRNTSDRPVSAEFHVVVDSGEATVHPKEIVVPGLGVKRTRIRVRADKSLETVGDVLATVPGNPPLAIPLVVKPVASYGRETLLLLLVPLGVAFSLVASIWSELKDRWRILGREMGPATFDFSKSFASTLTVGGAILGAILSAKVLPEDTELIPKDGYAFFAVIFGVIVLVAPLVYTAPQRSTIKAGKEPKTRGMVWAFLAASAMTLWGVFGELATVGAVLWEIHQADELPDAAVAVFGGVLAVAALLVWIYAWRTLRAISESQGLPRKRRRRRRVTRAEGGPAEVEVTVDIESLPQWSML